MANAGSVPDAVPDVLAHAQVREEREVLEHHAHASLLGGDEGIVVGDHDAVEADGSGIGALETGDEAQGGGLAAAAGPEQREHFAGIHIDVDGIRRDHRPETLRERAALHHGPRRFHEVQGILTSMADMHDTTEEYLEQIIELEEEGIRPLRARIVERLGLSAAAVSETVGRLVDNGFVEMHADNSLGLTGKGRDLATSVVRRHRLAERLLLDVIGLEWEKVHREADRWEHAISAEVEEKLVELLGDPLTCPHGNPIPGTKRTASKTPSVALALSEPGRVTVARISERLELSDDGLQARGGCAHDPGRDRDGRGQRSRAECRCAPRPASTRCPHDVAEQIYVSSAA